jgi:hypothetical protein
MPVGWSAYCDALNGDSATNLEQNVQSYNAAEWLAVRVLQDCNSSQIMRDDACKVLADLGWPHLAIVVARGEFA